MVKRVSRAAYLFTLVKKLPAIHITFRYGAQGIALKLFDLATQGWNIFPFGMLFHNWYKPLKTACFDVIKQSGKLKQNINGLREQVGYHIPNNWSCGGTKR